jgi:hypothetical protein
MEVITIESQAFSQLLTNLDNLAREIHSQNQNNKTNINQPLSKEKLGEGDKWIDGEEVCKILKISKRTLQNYRDSFILPYTQIGRKILYKRSAVMDVLEKHYVSLDIP